MRIESAEAGDTDWHSINHCRICSFIFSLILGPSVSLRASWVFRLAIWNSSSFSIWRNLLTSFLRLATDRCSTGSGKGIWGHEEEATGLKSSSGEDPALGSHTCPHASSTHASQATHLEHRACLHQEKLFGAETPLCKLL